MTSGQIGTIVILVLVLAVMAGGYITYRRIRQKVREFSQIAFGTNTLKEGVQKLEKEEEVTPKSVSAATSLYLPQIMRDFPEFHFDEMKNREEVLLTAYLQGIERKSARELEDGTTSELREKLQMKIDSLNNEDAAEHYQNIKIHRTEIKTYRKARGRCSIVFQSSIQYNYYKERGGMVTEGARDKLTQSRYNVEMIYIQDRDMVENQADAGLAMNCPNCGAPLPALGAKKCLYCDTPILEFNIRIWNFSDIEEG